MTELSATAEDAKRKEEVDIRNNADQLVYQSEKTLSEMGDKLDAGDKSAIEAALSKVKTALSGQDTQAIKSATEELQKAFYAASEKLYQQSNPQGGTAGQQGGYNPGAGAQGGTTGQQGGDYYDADYEVVDDDDNKK